MALIKCPECEAQVSDKADACVQCGYSLNFKRCPDCERRVGGDTSVCPGCGHPFMDVESTYNSTQPLPAEDKSVDEWWITGWRKFGDFNGRGRRKEYWSFTVGNVALSMLLAFVDQMLGTFSAADGMGVLSGLYLLAILIPSLSAGVRRLHDTGKSGWWLLIGFIPIVGLVLLVFLLQDSEAGENRFGPSPKEMLR